MSQEFSCSDKETLIGYIYGECDAEEWERVDRHLASCPACADEVAGFGMVREGLAKWSAPGARAASFRIVREEDLPAQAAVVPDLPQGTKVLRPARWWRRPIPGWVKAAAAVLLFATGLGLANLDVRYEQGALVLRTGWQRPVPAAARLEKATAPSDANAAPWRTDLAALEQQLRGEFAGELRSIRTAAGPTQASGPRADDKQILARVRALIDESEQRQQHEMAYRLTQVQGELGLQRRADLIRLQQNIGQIQGMAGAEIAQQRQLINYVLASQKK